MTDEDAEPLKLSYAAGGKKKKTSWVFIQLNIHLPYDPEIPIIFTLEK